MDQADRLGTLSRDLDLSDLRGEFNVGFDLLLKIEQAAHDGHEVLTKVGDVGARPHLQLGIDEAESANPVFNLLQLLACLQVGHVGKLQMNEAQQALVVVLDAVLQLLQQEFMLRR